MPAGSVNNFPGNEGEGYGAEADQLRQLETKQHRRVFGAPEFDKKSEKTIKSHAGKKHFAMIASETAQILDNDEYRQA